jgi:hypothetical protein
MNTPQNVVPLMRGQLGNPAPAPVGGALGAAGVEVDDSDASLEGSLAGFIKACFMEAQQQRTTSGVDERMLVALRAMRGEYPDEILRDIRQFGGSEVYARITAAKVRGVAALMREIYTSSDRPWMLSPTPVPDVPGPQVTQLATELLQTEIAEMTAAGGTPDEMMLIDRLNRIRQLMNDGRKRAAEDQARQREAQLDDFLVQGGFYTALWEFLLDLATFPFAVLKGPVVRMRNQLEWEGRTPVMKASPVMTWQRVSPFDVYFAPWAMTPNDGYVIHFQRTSRAELRGLRDIPSYNRAAIDEILSASDSQLGSMCDWIDSQRAQLEQRSSDMDTRTRTGADRPLPMLQFDGVVTGTMLREWGMPNPPADEEDMVVTVFMVGNKVIGARPNPHPQGKKPYYVDSFERVPGSLNGHGVPDLIEDVQQVANATLRALVNNMAIASGPMGWVNEDRMASNDPNATKLYPWKIWRATDAENGNDTQPPVNFFQPENNAQVLLAVYEKFVQMADEFSSLPRYMQGNTQVGGAGRTASGLSMLMDAANRTIKQTVASVDANIIEPVVEDLNLYLAMTRPDLSFGGDIDVVARGAVELVQRETLRMRKLEFLSITNNPMDNALLGPQGRGLLLKDVSKELGLPEDQLLAGLAAMGSGMPAPVQPGQPGQAAPGAPPGQQGPSPAAPTPQPKPTDGMATVNPGA